jgi:hypothetical protein
MKRFLLCLLILVFVRGHYRADGTWVRPHYRSAPDGIEGNNLGPSEREVKQEMYVA